MFKAMFVAAVSLVSVSVFAVPNCQVVVSSISVIPDVGYGRTVNYYSKNVKVPNEPVGEGAMVLDLVNDEDPKLKLAQATVWLGIGFDEGGMNDFIDATAKFKVKGQEVELNLMLAMDASFGTAMNKVTTQEGKTITYYHCNLTCRK